MCHLVYLGLGSNLGNGRAELDEAVRRLGECGSVVAVSGYVESEPWGFESEHRFTNAVAALATTLSPLRLLDATERIERQMGRTDKHRNGEPYTDRIIDIDILAYDNLTVSTRRLTLPHPHIAERPFVRIPLEECRRMVEGKIAEHGMPES